MAMPKITVSILFAVLFHTVAGASEVSQMCIAAGSVVREALRSEALRIAFNEPSEWTQGRFQNLPTAWRELVLSDVQRFLPDVTNAVKSVVKDIPEWDAKGMNGRAVARQRIYSGLESVSEVYAVRCIGRFN